ncbi:MAG: hypothetical protein ACR2LU_02320 [Luteitalea sp.]
MRRAVLTLVIWLAAQASLPLARAQAIPDAPFAQQMARRLPALPGGTPRSVDVATDAHRVVVVAGGRAWSLEGELWHAVTGLPPAATLVARSGGGLVVAGRRWLVRLAATARQPLTLPSDADVVEVLDGVPLRLLTRTHLLTHRPEGWSSVLLPAPVEGDEPPAVAAQSTVGRVVVSVGPQLYELRDGTAWVRIALRSREEGWDPPAIPDVAFDARDRLWVATSQGVAIETADDRAGSSWRFVDPSRGLPGREITVLAPAPDGSMWLGTPRGAIRISDAGVEYRHGRRWLPGDLVEAMHVDASAHLWVGTDGGLGVIESREATLAGKARAYEAAIAAHHRRTTLGYVVEARLLRRGDPASAVTADNDNDGLWTGMYGASQCFAYAATGSEVARTRARRAFEALRFLLDVTQGGPNAPPDGFPARSIRPTTGADPNLQDSVERDRRMQARDAKWKVLSPRWPRSPDGQWYWKTDTSSDELDGHYFFYALYHDLVAQDASEQAAVAAVVRRMTDHLLAHDYRLVDHDRTPTRWGVFAPDVLNGDRSWHEERGLNSLSMLTYLRIAHHMTGDARYDGAARDLVARHGYALNLMQPKVTLGVGGGNQSDDEMAFMNYYHLLAYEPDPGVRESVSRSLHAYWQLERPERNPLFNLVAAVRLAGLTATDAFGTETLTVPEPQWLPDTLDTLRRFPVDLIDWGLTNSHRLDLRPLDPQARPGTARSHGLRQDGLVLPVDERMVFHWNVDPYALDFDGTGTRLADGTSFLLPYYMALYHRVIAAPAR